MTTEDRYNKYIEEIMFFIPKNRINEIKRSWKELPEPEILLKNVERLFNQESLKIEKLRLIKDSRQLIMR